MVPVASLVELVAGECPVENMGRSGVSGTMFGGESHGHIGGRNRQVELGI